MVSLLLPNGQPVSETQEGITLANAQQLLREKDLLLEEMEHRFANSLQIIASILLIKARAVQSEETRLQLLDAHQRVLSVAAVQKHLHRSGPNEPIEIAHYLTELCETLAQSMIGDSLGTSLRVEADSTVISSRDAVSLGLIVTELVMNALKHAFPENRLGTTIVVSYRAAQSGWKLAVCDNGAGSSNTDAGKHGIGTAVIQAFARQLDACVYSTSDRSGTTVSVSHATLATPVSTIGVKSVLGDIPRARQ